MKIKITYLLIVVFLCCSIVSAQNKTVKKDSVQMYRDIEKFSKKSKFSKFMYKLIFRTLPTKKVPPKKKPKKIVNTLAGFEGKIIRKINVETLDPFGYSITDTIDRPGNWIEKLGNGIHSKSKKWTIRNYLLFKKNEVFDSIIVKESERLVQSQRFVRRAIIIPSIVENTKDSVDVTIRVLDSWSIIPTGSYSSSKSKIKIMERNFFGLGHEMINEYRQQSESNREGYSFRYTIPNFKNTFIKTTAFYTKDFDENFTKEISSERTFFSPLTRFGGGLSFLQRFYTDSIQNNLFVNVLRPFKFENQNYWGGYSFPFLKGNGEEDRNTNFVTTLRYSTTNYTMAPESELDTYNFFSDSKLYLASIGITRRKYIEDSFLFNYGIPEYVQTGQTISFTGGFEDKNNSKRSYFGGRYALGDYFTFGYLGLSVEAGSFFNKKKTEQTSFQLELNYFTNLFEIGNWRIRQFIEPKVTIGNNRLPIKYDKISINEESGIQGFTTNLYGTKKLLIAFQTQSYAPGMFLGFRLSPFFNATLGMLSDDSEHLLKSPIYSKFGIGVLISNDYLVFNSFQLSFAFYPKIPELGNNLFKTNSFQNDDLQLLDYQIGQPSIAPYK